MCKGNTKSFVVKRIPPESRVFTQLVKKGTCQKSRENGIVKQDERTFHLE